MHAHAHTQTQNSSLGGTYEHAHRHRHRHIHIQTKHNSLGENIHMNAGRAQCDQRKECALSTLAAGWPISNVAQTSMLRRKAINENTAEKTTYANASTATVRKRKWRTKPNCCANLDILLKWRTNPNQDTAHKQRNDCDQLSNYVNVQNANTRTTNSLLMLSTRADFYNSNLFPPGGHAQ